MPTEAQSPPELREDRGEIEAAAEGKLPELVSPTDIRGDLHSHSTYSDGKLSVEEYGPSSHREGL